MYDLTKPIIEYQKPVNRRQRRAAEKEGRTKEKEIEKLVSLFGVEIIEDKTPSWTYERLYQAYKGVYIRLMKQINQKSGFIIGNTRFFENTFKPDDGTYYYLPRWYYRLVQRLRDAI